MDRVTVGFSEFRDNLATYLLQSDTPVAITGHGNTLNLFIPARHKRTEAEQATLGDNPWLVVPATGGPDMDEPSPAL